MQPPLKHLLSRTEAIAGITGHGEPLPPFDLHCPMMTLPLAFGTELGGIPAEIPYIHAPEDRIPKWRDLLGPARSLRVAVAWAGSATHGNNRNRSIALSAFAELFAVAGIEFISLQKDLNSDTATLRQYSNVRVVDQELADFADTAAAISLSDLVVSVDTSVVHLAGALGKPVWILIPWAPDFRWLLDREDSPWYPSARLFRQRSLGDWNDVLDRVGTALRALSSQRGARP